MLSREHRLTSGRDYARAIRRGRRAGTATLVVHLLVPEPGRNDSAAATVRQGGPVRGPLVGLVVSKAVGNAVSRNQVKRRLRHLARERLASLPGSVLLVVRAMPPAAGASSAQLGADLDAALARALPRELRPAARRTAGAPA
ncbi:MAG: ribonuclease P protein component [Nocardioidaceae bacterium]